MNAPEWNKIIAALLLSILLYKGIEMFAEGAFEVAELETSAYLVAGLEVEAPVAAEAAAEVAPEEDIMALLAVASPEQGKRAFRRCQACHDANQGTGHKIGPNLYGVIGAPVAQYADYGYSSALADHGGSWDFATMDAWLAKPAEAIPGNKMTFAGMPKAGDRAALIAYLNGQSDSPLPLPVPAPAPVLVAPSTSTVSDAVEDAMTDAVEEVNEEMPAPAEMVEEMIAEPAAEAAEVEEEGETEVPDGVESAGGEAEGEAEGLSEEDAPVEDEEEATSVEEATEGAEEGGA